MSPHRLKFCFSCSPQSGNESRSRADSAARTTADDSEFIDYKALYEAEK